MALKGSPITATVAGLAIVVGSLSFFGGYLNERAADRRVCQSVVKTNASVRGLLDDFIGSNPKVTPAERAQADAFALRRFPNHC